MPSAVVSPNPLGLESKSDLPVIPISGKVIELSTYNEQILSIHWMLILRDWKKKQTIVAGSWEMLFNGISVPLVIRNMSDSDTTSLYKRFASL